MIREPVSEFKHRNFNNLDLATDRYRYQIAPGGAKDKMASARGLIAVGVPPFPSWILYIRIAILVLSLALLGVAAWAVSIIAGGASGMMIFVVCDSFGIRSQRKS